MSEVMALFPTALSVAAIVQTTPRMGNGNPSL